MKTYVCAAVATVLTAGSAVIAAPVFHFDINGITVQAKSSTGGATTFGGLAHTGSLSFGFQTGTSHLEGIDIQQAIGGAPQHQNFTGQLTNFTGTVNLVDGRVTGGNFSVVANGDTYSADIVPQIGAVSNYVGGGFKLEGLTFNGHFSDGSFGNINVSPWFNAQNVLNGLVGSFLQFNWNPNASGFSFADMDIFVDVVPLPASAWTGLATLAGIGLTGYIRGGVSPVGTKKAYPLYLDETAELWDVLSVSAGTRGQQMLVAPADLVRVTGAIIAAIAQS